MCPLKGLVENVFIHWSCAYRAFYAYSYKKTGWQNPEWTNSHLLQLTHLANKVLDQLDCTNAGQKATDPKTCRDAGVLVASSSQSTI